MDHKTTWKVSLILMNSTFLSSTEFNSIFKLIVWVFQLAALLFCSFSPLSSASFWAAAVFREKAILPQCIGGNNLLWAKTPKSYNWRDPLIWSSRYPSVTHRTHRHTHLGLGLGRRELDVTTETFTSSPMAAITQTGPLPQNRRGRETLCLLTLQISDLI